MTQPRTFAKDQSPQPNMADERTISPSLHSVKNKNKNKKNPGQSLLNHRLCSQYKSRDKTVVPMPVISIQGAME